MSIVLAILIGYAVGAIAPWVHRRGPSWSGWLLALAPVAAGTLLVTHGGKLMAGETVQLSYAWLPELDVSLTFRLDGLSLLFASLVCLIGACIIVYSSSYMRDHQYAGRFYCFMLMFMASMLGLVLADDIFLVYIFFELTSLFSFFLIGLDGESAQARRAARQAILVTNLGGLGLLAGLLLMGKLTGNYTISGMAGAAETIRQSSLYLPILLLVLLAAFTKSAQFPFYFWLPNAMAAPTPVSAYLHSATMVKAGVYLLARFHPILGETIPWQNILTGVGAFTMLVSAWLALRHYDLKGILAYTTIMALGLITMLLGVGTTAAVTAALLYVAIHACYKAALFMVAGAIDHGTHTRDVRRLGGLRRAMPYTFIATLLATVSMAGLPPFIGFIGKEGAYGALLVPGELRLVLLTASVLANVAVVAIAAVLLIRLFLGKPTETASHAHAAPPALWLGPILLGAIGLIAGLFPKLISGPLLAGAVDATLGRHGDVHLLLWHGWNIALAVSVVTVLAGVAVFLAWPRLRDSRAMAIFANLFDKGPDEGFEWSLKQVMAFASWQTRLLQNGRLTWYIGAILLTGVLLTTASMTRWSSLSLHLVLPTDLSIRDGLLLLTIVIASLVVLTLTSRLATILALSLISYCIALVFLLHGAPDLAITQFLVETLMAILLVLAFYHLPRLRQISSRGARFRGACVAILTGMTVTVMMLAVLHVPFDPYLSDFFAANSYVKAHGRNIVNVILVDFRALDTLGEITVICVAGLSIYALIRRQAASLDSAEGGEK